MFSERKIYDLAFIGLGASNSLIINSLYSANILQKLQIAIIEPDSKTKNDKTYCFWATPGELDELQLTGLIDQSWGKVVCRTNEVADINPLRYYHIPSINLYNHVKQLLSDCTVDYYNDNVTGLKDHSTESDIRIDTAFTSIHARKVYDSRPPVWLEEKSHQTFLWQSFIGWKIKTTDNVFDRNVFTMMDFEVDQSDATQFVYILPYSDNHALVELTRFGINKIDHDYARKQLEKYCKEKKWEFTVLEEEKGMIPMSSMDIKDRSVNSNHIQTGSAAGRVKPTTGYAFKEMAVEAIKISSDFSIEKPGIHKNLKLSRSGRFAFYDRLLLKILEKYPEKGKLIFKQLFANTHIRLVLKFLEQKTTIQEDFLVMMSLPKEIFIKQAIVDSFQRLQPIISLLFPFAITLFLLLLQLTGFETIGLIFLSVGLLSLGIPHGAMDHILDKNSSENLSVFVVKYLIKGALMLLFWKLSPYAGLLFFLLYSAWHFGEADFIKWKIQPGVSSFLWGFGMILFILFSHPGETGYILTQIFKDITLEQVVEKLSVTGCIISFGLMLVSFLLNKNKWVGMSMMTILLLSFLPLLQAFGVYFIFQHSLNGWSQIKTNLRKSDSELWRHTFPFTLAAVVLFLLFFTTPYLDWKEQMGSFFIFLSCISFPHVINMNSFYKSWNSLK